MTPERKPAVVNLEDSARSRPAGEVLAKVPWDRADEKPLDPRGLSAAEFLVRLLGE